MNFGLLDNRLVVAVIAGALGVIFTLLTQRILGKRGLLTYSSGTTDLVFLQTMRYSDLFE